MTDSYQIYALVRLALVSGLVTLVVTFAFVHFANKSSFLDHPNHRSSHAAPVAQGGGLVFMAVILIGWYAIGSRIPTLSLTVIVALGAIIAILSLLDDIKPLNPWLRLIVQSVICMFAIKTLPLNQFVFHSELPFWFDRAIAFLALLWFCNLFNFMDGIDGLAASEAVFICLALIVVGATVNWHLNFQAAIIAGALIAFLMFNWHPAKLFMGDVGSIGLGFLLGYLLLRLAIAGYLAAALIIPMYFVFDTTIILLIRMRRGYRIFTAHRIHSFHHAVDAGHSHGATVLSIMATNLFLFALAMISLKYPAASFAASLVLVSLVWWGLRKIPSRQTVTKTPPESNT